MIQQWISVETHRLQVVGEWPDSPRKQATIEAIASTLASLIRDARAAGYRVGNQTKA